MESVEWPVLEAEAMAAQTVEVQLQERLRLRARAAEREREVQELPGHPRALLTDQILTAPILGAADGTLRPTFRERVRPFSTIHPDPKTCRYA